MRSAEYAVKIIDKKNEWEKFVLSQNPKSFLQSWNWGETNKLTGNSVFRLGFFIGTHLVGVAQVIEEKARRGPHFLIPGGPLIDWDNKSMIKFALQSIKELAKKKKVWFVRIRPDLYDTSENQKLLGKLGFLSSPMHLHAENTWVLDVTPSEEEILKNMRKTTRYLVRQSLTKGLKIETYTDPSKTDILRKLQEETIKRHKFVGFSEKLFRAQLETFGQEGQAVLFVCKKGREALAAAIIIFYGKYAYYHHSGSTSKHKNLPFSYFLQWQVILQAKSRGLQGYNFWGIAPNDNPEHRFAGVTVFKKGFGGERIDWLHAQDLPISPLYRLTYFFETGRRVFRRL